MTLAARFPPIPWLGADGARLDRWRLDVTAGGDAFSFAADAILETPEFQASNMIRIEPHPRRDFHAEFAVVLHWSEDAESLGRFVQRGHDDVTARLWLLPPDGTEHEPVLIAQGTLAQWEHVGGRVLARFAGGYPGAFTPICRDAARMPGHGLLPAPAWLPQVFGRRGFPAVPLFPLRTARTANAVEASDVAITLTAPVDWPATGRVQLNDEVLDYAHLSEDRLTIGSEAAPLTRPEARSHGRGATAHLLPGAELRWCAADHEAQVLEVRAESAQGNLLVDIAVEHAELAGHDATLLTAARLPLLVTHADEVEVIESERVQAHWRIVSGNSALDPLFAASATGPARGATLTGEHATLKLQYLAEPGTGARRHDLLLGAAFSFEFAETPNWGPDTRLRITVSHGGNEVSALIDRRGFTWPAMVEAEAFGRATEPPAGESPADKIERLPVRGSVVIPLQYHRVEVSLAALLGGAPAWGFYGGEDAGLIITAELVAPPDEPLWATYVRDVHWRNSVYRAESVRATARPWVLVSGRHARPDGTANPANCLLDMLTDPILGSVEAGMLDAGSFTAAGEECDARGIAFAADFQEGTPVATLLARAVAEACGVLSWRAGLWTLEPAPLELDGAALDELPREDLFTGTGALHLEPASPARADLALHGHDGALLAGSAAGAGVLLPLRWLVAGGAALARCLESRRHPRASLLRARWDARGWPCRRVWPRRCRSPKTTNRAGKLRA